MIQTRRAFLGSILGGTAVASAAIARVSTAHAQATPGTPSSDDQGWSFTDDRGRTVDLPEMPTRIFADVGAGLALWNLGIKPVGLAGYPDVFVIPAELQDIPLIDVTDGLDLEEVKKVSPDLIVSQSWDTIQNNDFGGVDESMIPGILDVAPTIGIRALETSLQTQLDRFAELAGLLGADLDAPSVTSARDEFLQAADAVRTATAAKPGLKVVAISATPDEIYIGNPKSASDLILFAELGIEFMELAGTADIVSGLFEVVSWETINTYNADLFLNDVRPYGLTDEQVLAQPTFSLLPAAKAGQIGPWSVEYISSYQGVTPILHALRDAVEKSEIVTG